MPGAYGAVDPLFLLLAALAAEAYLGGLDWGFGGWSWPRRRFAELLRTLQQRLDRPERGPAALRIRGLLVAGLVLVGALVLGELVGLFTRNYPFAWAIELALLFGALRLRRSHRQGEQVLAALGRGSVQAARGALARLGAADLAPQAVEALPRQGLAVTAQTLLERRFADAAVAPAFWFVLLGLPGLFAWVAMQRACLVLGGPGLAGGRLAGAASAAFGRPTALLFAALRWAPARLAELLLAAARRLRRAPPPDGPLEVLAGALSRHALAGLLLAGGLVLLIVLRLLLRGEVP
ncbi:adenosylcobinamide-phosphate synthase [Tistlia consotensis]|uniref:Adenosylcobinamide-phosphate synthase n=1 Tax=Tistlia consotensis USBA 355 TaxID=560819 RepID=A0A1Y6B9B7_9PROT|nr:cobalamin biosynthesis protein [Tistlia consotensis]SME92466.1 adenosylcobinamide-phosphate synthase [Tistlia consotensis USBA 355]SNR28045.1 adenosylcobinamide-phosphate synthase [Tistlia consotensis]